MVVIRIYIERPIGRVLRCIRSKLVRKAAQSSATSRPDGNVGHASPPRLEQLIHHGAGEGLRAERLISTPNALMGVNISRRLLKMSPNRFVGCVAKIIAVDIVEGLFRLVPAGCARLLSKHSR